MERVTADFDPLSGLIDNNNTSDNTTDEIKTKTTTKKTKLKTINYDKVSIKNKNKNKINNDNNINNDEIITDSNNNDDDKDDTLRGVTPGVGGGLLFNREDYNNRMNNETKDILSNLKSDSPSLDRDIFGQNLVSSNENTTNDDDDDGDDILSTLTKEKDIERDINKNLGGNIAGKNDKKIDDLMVGALLEREENLDEDLFGRSNVSQKGTKKPLTNEPEPVLKTNDLYDDKLLNNEGDKLLSDFEKISVSNIKKYNNNDINNNNNENITKPKKSTFFDNIDNDDDDDDHGLDDLLGGDDIDLDSNDLFSNMNKTQNDNLDDDFNFDAYISKQNTESDSLFG